MPRKYAYDAFGRRVKKVASGKTTLYHYDSAGNLIAETDENGTPQRDYIYLNGEPVALRIYGAQFGTMYYFVNDHLGTPQKIVDSSGQVVWAAAYLPFGKAQVKPNTIENNLRFPGQYYDAESGLHYNWNRYYDPDTGRYITADPIGLGGGINLYSYVLNNPLNLADILGLKCWEWQKEYFDRWTVNAHVLERSYDIPSLLILIHTGMESRYGKSSIAVNANNLSSIQGEKGTAGTYTTEGGTEVAKYETQWDSLKAYAKKVTNKRYNLSGIKDPVAAYKQLLDKGYVGKGWITDPKTGKSRCETDQEYKERLKRNVEDFKDILKDCF